MIDQNVSVDIENCAVQLNLWHFRIANKFTHPYLSGRWGIYLKIRFNFLLEARSFLRCIELKSVEFVVPHSVFDKEDHFIWFSTVAESLLNLISLVDQRTVSGHGNGIYQNRGLLLLVVVVLKCRDLSHLYLVDLRHSLGGGLFWSGLLAISLVFLVRVLSVLRWLNVLMIHLLWI